MAGIAEHGLSMEDFMGHSDIFPIGIGTHHRRIGRVHDSAESIDGFGDSWITPRVVLDTLPDLTTWHKMGSVKPTVWVSPVCLACDSSMEVEMHLGGERDDGTPCGWEEICSDAMSWRVIVIRGSSVLEWFSADSVGGVMRITVPEQPPGVLKIILVKCLSEECFEALPVIPVLALPEGPARDMAGIFHKMVEAKAAEADEKAERSTLRQQVWVDYYRHLLWDIDAFLEGIWSESEAELDPQAFGSVMDTVLSYLLGVQAHHTSAFLLRAAQEAGWQVNFHGAPVDSISADYLKTVTEGARGAEVPCES